MEKVIVLFSVPLFLLFVLLIVVFVLANYSGNEPAKTAPAEVKAADTTTSNEEPTKSSPTVVKAADTTEDENNVVTKE
jgi:hypothetical protein